MQTEGGESIPAQLLLMCTGSVEGLVQLSMPVLLKDVALYAGESQAVNLWTWGRHRIRRTRGEPGPVVELDFHREVVREVVPIQPIRWSNMLGIDPAKRSASVASAAFMHRFDVVEVAELMRWC